LSVTRDTVVAVDEHPPSAKSPEFQRFHPDARFQRPRRVLGVTPAQRHPGDNRPLPTIGSERQPRLGPGCRAPCGRGLSAPARSAWATARRVRARLAETAQTDPFREPVA
jgi:hypothetical protein